MGADSTLAYRGGLKKTPAPLVFRYIPFVWYAPVLMAILASGMVWTVGSDSGGAKLLEHAGYGLVFLLLIGVRVLPVVSVRARIEAGHVIVSGCRWPGSETVWSCTLAEAKNFEVEVLPGAKNQKFWRLALRTDGERLLPLTETAWPGAMWLSSRLVAKLNAWLARADPER